MFTSWCRATDPDEEAFQRALTESKKNNFETAIEDFRQVISGGQSRYECEARLLIGKCYLKTNQLDLASAEARELISRFPHSRYAAHANFLLGEIAFLRGDYHESAWQLLNAEQYAQDDDLRHLAAEKLVGIFGNYLDEIQQQDLLSWVKADRLRGELQAAIKGMVLSTKIGVILDLSGPNGPIGEKILAGIEDVLTGMEQNRDIDLEIVSRDSRGSVTEAVLAARALIDEEGVVAIIGDYDGVCSAAIAGVTSAAGIPQIIPASQDVGLTQIGENVFQILTDYHLEGEIIASFARKNLKLKSIAVLAPASDEGTQRVEGFKSRFEALGGKISGIQWYYRGATNYHRQLDALLNPGTQSGVSSADTVSNPQNDLPQDSSLNDAEVDPNGILKYVSPVETPEANGYIDGLFVPIQGDEISILAPQIAATGFQGQLIGSSNCLDAITPDSDWRYVEGVVFASPFEYPEGLTLRPEYMQKYSNLVGELRDRRVQIGRDAMNFLCSSNLNKARLDAQEILIQLQKSRKLALDHKILSFSEGKRVNSALFIKSFKDGEFQTVLNPRELTKIFP
ncbi:MAG: ABC transporter substrate-binding protein [bacterium]|nr:ABC transporter substrate-binding protein [bacterium]